MQNEIVELENFFFNGKEKKAMLKEKRFIWERQCYPDFLTANENFYGDTKDEQAKRDFFLAQKEIHFSTAFRAAKKKNGKLQYENGKLVTTNIPCKWELKLYFKNNTSRVLYYSHGDEDTLMTVNYFIHKVIKERINPNGTWTDKYQQQAFKKALLIDRYSDNVEFEYPAKGYSVPSYQTAQKELLEITKYFKKEKSFPPAEYYSEEYAEEQEEIVLKPTPKISVQGKQATQEQQQVSNTVTSQSQNNSFLGVENNAQTLYFKVINSVIRTLNENDKQNFTLPMLDLCFGKYDAQNNIITFLVASQAHYDQIEGDDFVVLTMRKELVACFGENVKLEYSIAPVPIKVINEIGKIKKETSIAQNSDSTQVGETQPKTNETNKIEVESQIIKKEPLTYSYKKEPEQRFTSFLMDLITKTPCNDDDCFYEIKFVSLDIENEITTFSLPSHELTNQFLKNIKKGFFDLLFRSKIGGTYKVITQKT